MQERQTQFAVHSLRHLQAQHATSGAAGPWRVILVGHSMGGVVARAALAQLARQPFFGKCRSCKLSLIC